MNRITVAFFYFFNSFLLPLGLNFTTLFSPLFVIQLFKDNNSLKYAKQFLIILVLFIPFHFISGISYFQYFKSLLLFLSCVIFYNYFQTYLLETRIDRVYRFISKINIYLTGVAILVFFTPYQDLLWYNSIYTDGIDNVLLSGYSKTDQTSTVNIATVGKIGPSIDEPFIKELVKGKKFGDVQSTLGSIDGVSGVDIKFSYFWVSTVPTDSSKIKVEFNLQDV